jgi:hypothetical protein
MRVQIPDVPFLRHFLAEILEEIRLIRMVVGASALRMFGIPAGAGNVAHFKAVALNTPEERYGELQSAEALCKLQELAEYAVL